MPWPTHPDGKNKRIGDMTPDERAAVMAAARKRYFAEPEDIEDDVRRLRAAYDILIPLTRRGFKVTIEIEDVEAYADTVALDMTAEVA